MIFNIFRYENTDKSALYTYDVDVCFAAVLAAKIGFPWIYEYITGNNCTYKIFDLVFIFIQSSVEVVNFKVVSRKSKQNEIF